jgi:hypothetical protein
LKLFPFFGEARYTKGMKLFMLLCAVLFVPISGAFAQFTHPNTNKEGEVLSKPICTDLVNASSVTIQGTIATAAQITPDGTSVRHRDNFRLQAGEKKQICASGPFYEGRRLELVIRTLFPLFECKTRIDRDILIRSTVQEDGTRKYSANCR